MSDDVSVAEASDSKLLRMLKEDPRYEEILKIRRKYDLDLADLVWGSKTPGGCSLLFALNYEPDRNDTLQPSIKSTTDVITIDALNSLRRLFFAKLFFPREINYIYVPLLI